MRILGVDPGSIVTGYGVIDVHDGRLSRIDSGVIVPGAGLPMPQRLRAIHDTLADVIARTRPGYFSIETAFFGKNIQSTLKLGQVRGVALLAAEQSGLEIREYSPREVKRAVTGNGGAGKQQVQYMVGVLLSIDPVFARSDEADGLALAICRAVVGNVPTAEATRRGAGRQGGRRGTSAAWSAFLKDNPDRIRS